LRRLRLERGLTQGQLASPHYTHAHVSTVEAGKRQPSSRALEHFAQKLGVEVEEILSGQPPGLARQLRLGLHEARVDISGGRRKEAENRLRNIELQAEEFDLLRVAAGVEELRGLAAERAGDHESALRRYERCERALSGQAPTARAFSVAGRVRCLTETGDAHHAIYAGESYLQELDRAQMRSPDATLRVLSPLVLAYFVAGATGKADEAAVECERLAVRVNDPAILAAMHMNVASSQISRRLYLDADASLQKAEELYERLDLQDEVGTVHLARGYAMARRGALDEAYEHLQTASEHLAMTGNSLHRANAEMEMGRIDRLRGHIDEAVERLSLSVDELPADAQVRIRAWAHRELALCFAGGDVAQAEKHFQRAMLLYEQSDHPVERARTGALLGDMRSAEGDAEGALDAYRQIAPALSSVPDL
jgi:tetratricopeptide (TPR) repeat protein